MNDGLLFQRLFEDWQEITRAVRAKHLIAAVSGGPDSMAMLHLLKRLVTIVGDCQLTAAHFNHRLRPAADADEQLVRRRCELHGIRFVRGEGNVEAIARKRGISIHAAARLLRYDFLTSDAVSPDPERAVLTAHHLDDQFETMLMRLFAGAGSDGLVGIRRVETWRANGIPLIRPLLSFRRHELLEYCTQNNIPYTLDETNTDTRYPRNFIRHRLLPLVEEGFGASGVTGTGRTAEKMALGHKVLQHETARAWDDTFLYATESEIALDFKRFFSYLSLLRIRILQAAFIHLTGDIRMPAFRRFERIERMLLSGDSGTTDMGNGIRIRSESGIIYVYRPLPPFSESELRDNRTIDIPGYGSLSMREIPRDKRLDPAHLPAGLLVGDKAAYAASVLTVSPAQPGDVIIPLGMTGRVNVTDVLRQFNVPAHHRSYPVIRAEGTVVAIPPFRIAESIKVTPRTETVIIFRWTESPRATPSIQDMAVSDEGFYE